MRQFAVAMNVLDIPGTVEDHDALFDAWDADGSGGINLKEIREALIALQKEGGEDMHLKAAAALLEDFE
jgi:Ca2+-binding EF-hand superfamily protein